MVLHRPIETTALIRISALKENPVVIETPSVSSKPSCLQISLRISPVDFDNAEAARIGASYNQTSGQSTDVIPTGTRWLALLVGCMAFIVGAMPPSPVSTLPVPSTFVLGAIVQPYSPRPGRWLLSVGAFYLSLIGVPYLALMVAGGALHLVDSKSLTSLLLLLALVAPLVLLIWCDVALILDARRQSRNPQTPGTDVARLGDWLVFMAAACLSLTVLPGSFRAARTGRWDILALQLLFAFVVILFDGALIGRTIRMRRAQRST
jgi:hypothetical protein